MFDKLRSKSVPAYAVELVIIGLATVMVYGLANHFDAYDYLHDKVSNYNVVAKEYHLQVDELTTTREALRQLAAHDPLTSLWNHNAIIELLTGEITRAERQWTCVGVILADLDRFKSINDTHGHLIGDHVLRQAAQVLGGSIRPYDAVGRLGGEEFLIVVPGCDRLNAVSHAERLRVALGRTEVVMPTGGPLHFTASFGVTIVGPDSYCDAETAIHIADSGMYAAKHAGRDRVEFRAAHEAMLPA